MRSTHGRCLCGAVRFSFDPTGVLWRAHCHCESCRRHTASPFTTWFSVRNSAWRWTGAAPGVYRSSPGVRRFFCATCGTPMAHAATRTPDETHFYAASLEDASDFHPELHLHWADRLPWVQPGDDLPRHAGGMGSEIEPAQRRG